MRDVHQCVTVDYQQIANDNIANQIHGFTIDYGKFILKLDRNQELAQAVDIMMAEENTCKENTFSTIKVKVQV